jgi:hypothetical protein
MDRPGVRAMELHDQRRIGSKHVDLKRSRFNKTFVGEGSRILAALDARQKKTGAKLRKNIKEPYVMGLCVTSPEFFEGSDHRVPWDVPKVREWARETIKYLKSEFGENLVWAAADMDEKTPHIDFAVLPVVEERRKVKGKEYFKSALSPQKVLFTCERDGETGYSIYQTAYAKALDPLGIERGELGSEAEYRPVKDMNELKRKEAEFRAVQKAFEIGVQSIVAGEIIGAIDDNESKRLLFDPEIEPSRRDDLSEAVEPAFTRIWALARSVAHAVRSRLSDLMQIGQDQRQIELSERELNKRLYKARQRVR